MHVSWLRSSIWCVAGCRCTRVFNSFLETLTLPLLYVVMERLYTRDL
jgi:hypothetical protein